MTDDRRTAESGWQEAGALPRERAAAGRIGRMLRRLLRRFLLLALGAAALWLGGLIAFASSLPEAPAAPERRTDAIVVLTGGAERLDVGLDLLLHGKAERLFVSGVDRATTAEALQARGRRAPAMFACCVELGHQAADTIGNAFETALWVRERGYRSIRLVTAVYHMPRSLLLFRHAMPEIEMLTHPVFPPHVKHREWWRYPGTARLLTSEFNKYLVSLLTVRLSRLADESAGRAP